MPNNVAVVLAAGHARRMGQDKMRLRIGGLTVLERALAAIQSSNCFNHIIVVHREDDFESAKQAAARVLTTPYTLVAGGSERQYSVENALRAIQGNPDIVAIHDGARCFVSPDVVCACVEAAQKTGAAAAGVKTRDTIKTVDGDQITGTIDRTRLVNIQTPQVFAYALLCQAHKKAEEDGFLGTDECALVERLGHPIRFVEASYDNIKITTQEDIVLGRMIAGETIRTGTGYDAHRLVQGRPLILGGVHIPHTHGLLGHSDADVLLHAVMDALLGAGALGDIGLHFPCTDVYKDACSLDLLAKTNDLLKDNGYAVVNVDATVTLERPKLRSFIDEMRGNIARVLNINIDAVNVKATTTEGMGFEGTGEGASAMAVATIVG